VRLHVYGVVRASHPLLPSVVPRLVFWQDLAAAVSELPADREPTEQDVLAQLEVLATLVTRGPVVPLRFGTVAADEDAVRAELLVPAAPRLRAQFDRLDGLVEAHVCLRFEETAALRAVFAAKPEWLSVASRGGPLDLHGRIQLGELVAAQLVDWRRARSDALLAPIVAVASGSVTLPEREHIEERRAFLLPHEQLPAVRAVVAQIDEQAAVTASCVGPLPGYSFLDEPGDGTATESGSRWGW
jgi:hypothetical protein